MPSRSLLLHFSDILDAIFWIENYVEGLSYSEYQQDTKTRDAVERRLQIVTEAVIRLGDAANEYSHEVQWSSWRGLGNFLRHGYHKIDDEIIWSKLQNELPLLKQVATQVVLQWKRPQ